MDQSPAGQLVLLPQPQDLAVHAGTFDLNSDVRLLAPDDMETPERAAVTALRKRLERIAGNPAPAADTDEPGHGRITLRIDPAASWPVTSSECYRLVIAPHDVQLTARSPVALLQGTRTLMQIAESCGSHWPCLDITDYPDFAVRGFYHDVSRGKVPTVATVKRIVDRLARLKANQLQLYVEHVFDFAFDPDIGRGCSPLTGDDIREIDAYCREQRIDFVPSLASFGHMGRVLSLPAYRSLGEIELPRSWEQMTWAERMRGGTLDPRNAQTRDLLERMYAEYLPLFTSRLMNACADETFDLGKGKNQARAAETDTGRLYLDHVLWLHELCTRHDRRLMIWGDVVKQQPERVPEIPKDIILLNWLYDADSDYDSTALFQQAGLETYVCPGCSGWNRFVNGINNADLNIRRFAAAGVKYGSAGLLNTDWGDEGHVNPLACSWHPMALGAAMAWNEGVPDAAGFDRAFDFFWFGRRDGAVSRALRDVARAGDDLDHWRVFYAPFDQASEHERMGIERADQAECDGEHAAALLDESHDHGCGDALDCGELATACRLVALTGRKVKLVAAGRKTGADDLVEWAHDLRTATLMYEDLWAKRNKRSELDRVLDVCRRRAEDAEQRAGRAREGA